MKYLLCGINAKYIHSNLAIFCLRAYAKKQEIPGAEYKIKEYTINHYVDKILEDLYEEKADVIIFSCYIWNISYVKELAAEIKKVSRKTVIWAGGPEVSYNAEQFLLENPAVDLVMQGEGEEQFAALCALWEQGQRRMVQEISLPAGVVIREGDGCRNMGFAPQMKMDDIPFVYEDFQLFKHKILYYETSRGCPFCCSYCLSSVDRTVRFRSLELVRSELQRFLDAKVPQVKFVDRTFNCKKAHAMAIWSYIEEHDNGVTNFHFEISADLLGEEELALFARMRPGLVQLEIGVQSTYPATVKAIRRHMNLSKLFANVDRVHEAGNIHQHLDLIAGLPYETYGQFRASFNDLYIHKPDQLQLGFLKVLKGTCMEEQAKDFGIRYREMPPYEVLETRWLSYDDVIKLKGIEELVETYYNSGQFSGTLRYVIPYFPGPFEFYEAFSDWYRKKGYHKMNHNRMAKYEILRNFLQERQDDLPWLDEMLLFDMYLRENLKARPGWARDLSGYKKEWKQMYRERGKELFPKKYEKGSYDSKRAANTSHMEPFGFHVEKWAREGVLQKEECLCLFDYEDKNPLNGNAQIRMLCIGSPNKTLECRREMT